MPNPLPISALQHLLFCERQCALIHVEQLWAENRLTVEGKQLHEKTDRRKHRGPRGGGRIETRRDESGRTIRIVRRLPLRSDRLRLWGFADVVEFCDGQPTPVEYKRGRPKRDHSDAVQVCAQAMCLEEMLGVTVPTAILYYGKTKHRHDLPLDEPLRRRTTDAAERLHELIASGETPRVARQPKCDRCSMLDLCLPGGTGPKRSASRYVSRSLAAAQRGHVPADVEAVP